MTSSVGSGAEDTVPDGSAGPARGGPATTVESQEVTQYVAAVRASLADLPPAARDELVEDLPEHLTEVLAEGGGPLTTRLGSPEAYAAELRSAAGAVGAPPGQPAAVDLATVARRVRRGLRAADVRLGPVLGYPRVSEFLDLLRPAWWVLRGYLAAMMVVYLLDDDGRQGLLPRLGDSDLASLVILAGFVIGSVWLGRRTDRLTHWPRYALRAGTVLLLLMSLVAFADADSDLRNTDFGQVYYDNNRYGHVQDVFVYDEQGRLLQNVRLFDQDGQPIQLGHPACSTSDDEGRSMLPGWGYPHCPERAPFARPVPGQSAGPTEGPPGPVAVPTPDASGGPATPTPSAPNPVAPGGTGAPTASAGPAPAPPVSPTVVTPGARPPAR